MKEKLEFLMKNKGLSATSLARLLEIQPSGVSHILSGRNRPSFDLVTKILRAFPDVNPDWLLLDDEQVFRSETVTPTLRPINETEDDYCDAPSLFDEMQNIVTTESSSQQENDKRAFFSVAQNSSKRIVKVIVLYSDHSFDSYSEM